MVEMFSDSLEKPPRRVIKIDSQIYNVDLIGLSDNTLLTRQKRMGCGSVISQKSKENKITSEKMYRDVPL